MTTALRAALAGPNGERKVHAVLKKFPIIIYNSLCIPSASCFTIPEFRMGRYYRADCVALAGFSGGFDVHFIELEPPTAKFFNKNGTAAIRLRGAMHQLEGWRNYVETRRAELINELSIDGRKHALNWRGERDEPTCNAGLRITDRRMSLHFFYKIVMGRRDALSPDDLQRKASYKPNYSIELVTYDRLVDTAIALETPLLSGESRQFPIQTE